MSTETNDVVDPAGQQGGAEAGAFDRAVTATPDPERPGHYRAALSNDWSIGNALNGGFLLALLGRTLQRSLAAAGSLHPDPVSISATYLSAAVEGPAYLDTEVIRTGRAVSTGQVALTQEVDGVPVERLRATATYADLTRLADEDPQRNLLTRTMPELAPPEECWGKEQAPPGFLDLVPLQKQLDVRMTPDTVGWIDGKPTGEGRISAWFRMPDGRDPDPILMLMVLDCLPPVTFNLDLPGWAPTLSLMANVRARPVPGWLLVTHETRMLSNGLFEEDAEIWDASGTLVAQSRQLAMIPKRG